LEGGGEDEGKAKVKVEVKVEVKGTERNMKAERSASFFRS
jgi:hypothetical protein